MVRLFYLEEMNIKELEEITGLSNSNIKVKLVSGAQTFTKTTKSQSNTNCRLTYNSIDYEFYRRTYLGLYRRNIRYSHLVQASIKCNGRLSRVESSNMNSAYAITCLIKQESTQ